VENRKVTPIPNFIFVKKKRNSETTINNECNRKTFELNKIIIKKTNTNEVF
jgi:hypothetical protein